MVKRLWSKRYSPARGWFWQHERDCSEQNAERWMALFKEDERNIEFMFSPKRPKIKEE